MKRTILAIITLAVIGLFPMHTEAQGFLKKLNKKLEQTNNKLKELNTKKLPTTNRIPQSNSSDEISYSSEGNTNTESKDIYPDLVRGEIIRSYDNYSHKETPSTKIVNVKDNIELSDFHDGMALVKEGQKYYFISTTGEKCPFKGKIDNPTLPLRVEHWPKFNNGRALIKSGQDWVIINKQGNIVKNLTNISSAFGFTDGIGMFYQFLNNSDDRKVSYMDTNGNSKFPMLSYTTKRRYLVDDPKILREKSEGLTATGRVDPANGYLKWGFFNEAGTYAIPPKYNAVRDFHDGVAAVQEFNLDSYNGGGGKWGFINTKGDVIIDFMFSNEPSDFDSGYALVKNKEGKTVVIDKQGNIAFRPQSGWDISNFLDGHAILSGSELKGDGFDRRISYAVTNGGNTKVAYNDGEFLRNIEILNGRAYYSIGMHDLCWLDIPTMTTKVCGLIRPFSEGIAAVPDGYINEKGEYIIRFKISEF